MAAAMERMTRKEFGELLCEKYEENDYIGYLFTCAENADGPEESVKQSLVLYRPVKGI